MAKTLVLYDKQTGELRGVVTLSTDSDARFYPENPNKESVLEIPNDDPRAFEQERLKVVEGKLEKIK